LTSPIAPAALLLLLLLLLKLELAWVFHLLNEHSFSIIAPP
jgi:hypothetical protein